MNEDLKKRVKAADYEKAVALLDEYIITHPEDDEAYLMRGMRHWGASKRSLAINDYLKAVELNPESKASQALKAAKEILDFRNNDMFNP